MKKIAIVYDWVDKTGGVERMLQTVQTIVPEAPLYTAFYEKKNAPWADTFEVRTSWMQKLPEFIKKSRILSLPFFPYAFESLNFSEFDLVISVSSSFSKGIVTKPGTKHINIMLTPPRYLWSLTQTYLNGWRGLLSLPMISGLRKWDYIAGQRPDTILAISSLVAERCRTTYKRDAEVVYPPFDSAYWETVQKNMEHVDLPDTYFLMVCRLEKYKQVEMAVRTFNQLADKNLVIVGTGSELDKLKRMASTRITFIESATDRQLAHCYTHADGLIMLQEEDFGYTAVEALYFGCPVITYRNSGAAEVVEDGVTGLYVSEQSEAALMEALERFSRVTYNVSVHVKKKLAMFSVETFKKEILNYL